MKKEFRSSGVAQMLYNVALDHMKRQPWKATDNPALVLVTNQFNLAAIRFYKRQGFHEVNNYDEKVQPVMFTCRIYVFFLPLEPFLL